MTAKLLKKWLTIAFIFFFIPIVTAGSLEKQGIDLQKKTLAAVRAGAAPKIDGVLDDEIWQKGTLATDFVMYNP
ncbi:MAG: hypothetical protein IH593_07840, partial [Bacteroidales bacterium]|nr:hypothetical protein [Bacteroidales bacterium]